MRNLQRPGTRPLRHRRSGRSGYQIRSTGWHHRRNHWRRHRYRHRCFIDHDVARWTQGLTLSRTHAAGIFQSEFIGQRVFVPSIHRLGCCTADRHQPRRIAQIFIDFNVERSLTQLFHHSFVLGLHQLSDAFFNGTGVINELPRRNDHATVEQVGENVRSPQPRIFGLNMKNQTPILNIVVVPSYGRPLYRHR